MKVLLDEHLSHRMRSLLIGHDVCSVEFMGWRGLENGELLSKAAAAGFDALLTMDFGMEYEQNLTSLPCSLVVIKAQSNAIEHLLPVVPAILAALSNLQPKSFLRLQ